MLTVTGIVTERAAAERTVDALARRGIPRSRITMLTPGAGPEAVAAAPTTEAEAPGVGRVLGGVVGGAAGAAGGVGAGALVALTVPGVGPVLALGLLGAAVLGVGGAAAGAALEARLREGLPRDDLYGYEDALRRGRTVLIALVEDEGRAAAARDALAEAGAERVDAARAQWRLGLRDVEAAQYEPRRGSPPRRPTSGGASRRRSRSGAAAGPGTRRRPSCAHATPRSGRGRRSGAAGSAVSAGGPATPVGGVSGPRGPLIAAARSS